MANAGTIEHSNDMFSMDLASSRLAVFETELFQQASNYYNAVININQSHCYYEMFLTFLLLDFLAN